MKLKPDSERSRRVCVRRAYPMRRLADPRADPQAAGSPTIGTPGTIGRSGSFVKGGTTGPRAQVVRDYPGRDEGGTVGGDRRAVRAGRGRARGAGKTAASRRSPGPMNKTAAREWPPSCAGMPIPCRPVRRNPDHGRRRQPAAIPPARAARQEQPGQPGRGLRRVDALRRRAGRSRTVWTSPCRASRRRCRRTPGCRTRCVGLMPEILLKLLIVNSSRDGPPTG